MAVIKLVGPATTARGSLAVFSVALDDDPVTNTSLAPGGFIDITLDSASGSALEGTDFARLLAADLNGADPSRISLSNFNTNSTSGAVSLRITNTGTTTLQRGTTLLSFALATREDAGTATNYNVSLVASNPADSVSGAATITTTIEAGASRILNWGSSVGNRTIDTTGSFIVPETDGERFARTGQILPANLVGKNDYGLGFNFTIDATSGDGTFLLGNDGLKISSGGFAYAPPTVTTTAGQFEIGGKYTISSVGGTDFTLVGAPNSNVGTTFTATSNGSSNGSGTATSDGSDYLYAIGYPPGVLTSGAYINALNLSTLRLGNGNDLFSVIGTGITQAVRANVSIDSSFGYIFQSSIFAGSGDDTLRVLMPWQSTFKGGTNTVYYDAIFGSNPGNGIGITIGNALTLEEVPYGDLIELKGSRFDWDIEFKDGNGDGNVTLESILDERDYLAVANNNQISGFERILFGDILFDLVLYRQQQSSVVYGQPEYYLNGLENLAPELNSDIASGSKLWEAFRFNRTKLQGITGTATDQTVVVTGDTNDTPFIVGALRFASLNTEAGNDIVEIGTSGQTSVDQASIDLGSGTDQLKVNGLFTRSSVVGGGAADNIILTTVSNATVDGGTGDDVVEITTSVSQTVFTGGDGNDVLILPGTYASYLLTSSVTGGVITFSDGFGNSITGFETLKFSDINLDALQQLSLTGSATVDEGNTATYTVSLNGGGGLLAGESVAFSLQLNGSGSNPTNIFTDLATLAGNSLQASAGIVLKNISIDTTTGLIRAVATAARDLAASTDIATLSVPVNADLLTESAETFQVTLRDFGTLAPLTQQIETTIIHVPPVTIRLVGPSAAVTEGSNAAFTVELISGILASGRSIVFSLDSASGTAIEGSDYTGLTFGGLTPAPGIALGSPTTDPLSGAVTLTLTNNTGSALIGTTTPPPSSPSLLTFNLLVNVDSTIEGPEGFSVTLSSTTAIVSSGVAATSIADLVVTPKIALIGESSVAEGAAAAYAVALDGTALAAGQSFSFSLDTAGFVPTVNAGSIVIGNQYKILTAGNTNYTLIGAPDNNIGTTFTATAVGTGTGTASDITFGTATEGSDFAALIASAVTAATGITLSAISTDPVSKKVSLTATNTSGAALDAGRQIVSFSVNTSQDLTVETGGETFSVTLADPAGATLGATTSVTTTISDDDGTPQIKLIGESSVAEGAAAAYAVVLDGTALAAGQSFSFSLDTSAVSATEGSDFAALIASAVTAATGITLSAISTDPISKKVSLTATNTSGAALDAGRQIVTFSVNTSQDLTVETGGETFSVTLADPAGATLGATTSVTTTISDDDVTLKIRLDADSLVAEGGSANYLVSLDGTVLRAGENVRLRLDSASGTNPATRATEAADFPALIAANLQAVDGITLSSISTAANGAVTLTATNTSGFDLPDDTLLLRFRINTNDDVLVEGTEDFSVALTSTSASVTAGTGSRTTSITDNDTAAIKLTGATTVAEGGSASYAVSLDGVGLGSGRALTITLDSSGLSANESSDFAALLAASLIPAAGISSSAVTTAANGAVTLTLTNTGADLAAGAQLLSFSLNATADILPEINETFSVSLSSSSATVTAGTITTTINDDDLVAIQINGSGSVAEGAGASYSVDLNGVGLGVGRSVTFTLDAQGLGDAASLSARKGGDFTALLASALTAGSGLSLATSAGSNGALIVTATNTGATDLPVNSRILSFSLATTPDLIAEADETFSVTLTSSSATVGTGSLTTTITDNDPLAVRISGPSTVEEGAATAAYTVSLGSTVGLGAGRSVQFSLDSAGGSANEGLDYAALVASSLRAAPGIALSTTAGAGGLLNITATRTGSTDLGAGAELLSFALSTTLDNTNEAAETFTVTLAGVGGASVEGAAVVTTAISEDTGPFRRVLNYGRSVGNTTIQPGVFVVAPLTVEEGFAQDGLSYPADVPKELIGGFDYGLYFEYFREETLNENGIVTAVTGKFNIDQASGLKVARDGLIRYSPDSGQNDQLIAIGYPVGSLTSGVYINALDLTTIRMGAGNDSFSLTGKGITQKLNAEVSKEESAGYIFQSSIFAEGGDDTVQVLMPFQSRFSGGSNTSYRDAIFDPTGTGTPITLSASLTVEEIRLGDLIELKGSRYDWDIEFKDGPDAGSGVSLASILDDSSGDYLAISNNNQVSGFERIRFGDILFDLILARQQDSAAVYGQPDYYLVGAEKEAPELNSDINQNSQLWEAFRFNRTKLQGIVGTATDFVDVFTGDARDTPYLVGALKFASLNTEGGDDIVVIGSGEQAAVNLGSGSDQLEVKGAFTRSSVDGGDGNDGIILATVSNATVITGAGDDIVSVLTDVSSTILNGGAGTADQLLLPTTFAASALTSTVSAGAVNFSDAFGNSITGFETFKFSDITLDALETLTLTGPAAPVRIAEGTPAVYDINLASTLNGGNGLQTGQSVAFTLKISNGTDANPANIGTDLGTISADLLTAAPGLVLRSVNVDSGSGLIRVLASAATTIAAGSRIATLSLPVIADLLTETDESFSVTLRDFVQTVAITSTISNVAPATIRLVELIPSPGTGLEGGSASYAVELDGVGLAAGRAVTITLDSASGTATEAVDFAALVPARLTAAIGVTLGTPTVDTTTGAVTITATNTGATALPVGARLLTFQLPISVDAAVEGDETYTITLSSTTAAVSTGLVTSTIRDLVPTPIISLSGQSTVNEGLSATYAVSLSSGGLLPGQSFTLTLAATGGTATVGIDFVALLLEGALTAGEGITLGKVSVDPATKAARLSVTNSSQKALAVGAQLLSFNVATIADSAAEGNETYTINLSSNTATVTTATVTTTITETPTTPTVSPPATPGPQPATPGTGVSFNPGPITVGSSSGSTTPAAQTASFTDTSVKTLAELINSRPLNTEAKALLSRYTVNPTNSSTPVTAAEETASFIDFSINVGGLQTIVAEIELAKEVKANAYVKVNPNTGEAFDFTFDPITGLGAELLDKNNNGLVDNLRIHLRDGALGDVDGQFNGQIRDPGVLAEAPRVAVYRFYRNGIHFYTTNESERDNIIARSYGNGVGANDLNGNPKARDLITGGLGYQYEGVAYEALDTQGTALYRFFNPGKGYHFMTTNADEALNVIRNSVGSAFNLANAQGQTLLSNGWGYQYEGRSYKVSTIAQTGMNTPVYRFYNRNKGVHFYSSSLEEAKSVVANSLGAQYATDNWITSTTEALKQNPLSSTPAPLANGWGYQFEGAGFFV